MTTSTFTCQLLAWVIFLLLFLRGSAGKSKESSDESELPNLNRSERAFFDTKMFKNADADVGPLDARLNRKFKHRPIDLQRQIRVLKPMAEVPSAQGLHFEFGIRRPSKRRHTALSYTWGEDPENESDLHRIIVGGRPFMVRRNLYNFMVACIFEENEIDGLHQEWFIDAVCIDQMNVIEKNHQIPLMCEVYSKAKQVVIWTPFGHKPPKSFFASWNLINSTSPLQWGWPERSLFSRLFGHPYWKRMWPIQEVLANKSLTLCFGPGLVFRLSKSLAANYHDWMESDLYRVNWGRAELIIDEWSKRLTRTQNSNIRLYDALRLFSNHECERPHDKIYALLGLVTEGSLITPDYNKPLDELYEEVAPHICATILERAESEMFRYDITQTRWQEYDLFATAPDFPHSHHEKATISDDTEGLIKDVLITRCRWLCEILGISEYGELTNWDYIYGLWNSKEKDDLEFLKWKWQHNLQYRWAERGVARSG